MSSTEPTNEDFEEVYTTPVDLTPFDWQEENRRQTALRSAVEIYGEVGSITDDPTGIADRVLTIASRFEGYLRGPGSGSNVREAEGSGDGKE